MPREGPSSELRSSTGEFELALPEIPGSGYLWRLGEPPPEVELLGDEFTDAEPGLVGGSGTRLFRLAARSPGRYRLELLLQRPWEEEPLERRLVTVIVGDDSP